MEFANAVEVERHVEHSQGISGSWEIEWQRMPRTFLGFTLPQMFDACIAVPTGKKLTSVPGTGTGFFDAEIYSFYVKPDLVEKDHHGVETEFTLEIGGVKFRATKTTLIEKYSEQFCHLEFFPEECIIPAQNLRHHTLNIERCGLRKRYLKPSEIWFNCKKTSIENKPLGETRQTVTLNDEKVYLRFVYGMMATIKKVDQQEEG